VKITQSHDQLLAVGETVEDVELVNMALNGFPTSWEPFVKGICAWENFCYLRDFGMTISRRRLMESKVDNEHGEENFALFGQSNKGRGKGPNKGKGKSENSTSQPGKDLSKIKCVDFHKHDHYVSQYPDKKGKGKQVATSVETWMNESVAKFEKDFSLVSSLSTSTTPTNV
jgi:hypothetical protein